MQVTCIFLYGCMVYFELLWVVVYVSLMAIDKWKWRGVGRT